MMLKKKVPIFMCFDKQHLQKLGGVIETSKKNKYTKKSDN